MTSRLSAVLIAAGLVNAAIEPAAHAWYGPGPATALSPLILLVSVIAVAGLGAASKPGLPPRMADAVFLLVLLVPSSLVAWGATGAYAIWLMADAKTAARHRLLLVVGLCLTAIWQLLAIRLLGRWLLLPDALVTEHLLNLLRGGVERSGNVIEAGGGHRVVILAACSTLQTLPLVLVGAFAFGGGRPAPIVTAGSMYVLLNAARLAMVAWSADLYALLQGPIGQNVFEVLVIALLVWTSRPQSRFATA